MDSYRRFLGSVFLCGALPFAGRLVQAQSLNGSLVGDVRDGSDATISEAAVTLTNIETKQVRETVTGQGGNYNFATVLPGTYSLKVNKSGFNGFSWNNIVITASNVTRVDAILTVGNVAESVTVSATYGIQTDGAEVRHELDRAELDNIPIPLGRNYQSLLESVPGFSVPQNANSVPSNPARALTFSVNGADPSVNSTRVDGATTSNIFLPAIVALIPTLESIASVNISTNSFDAETGMAGGAAISIQTKNGTNDLHGSGFENHTDNRLKANPFFLPVGSQKGKLVYNEFGGTVGGRLIRDKLFYFLSYEGTTDHENAAVFATVPTAAVKSGDLSISANPIYDPLTGTAAGANRTPFAGNIIPADRLDSIIGKVTALVPLPNVPGNLLTNNYYASGAYFFNRERADTKVNWNPNSKTAIFGRFGMLNYEMFNPQVFGKLGPEISAAGGNPGEGTGSTYSLTLGGTYLITPNLILDGYFAWEHDTTAAEPQLLDQKIGQQLGIPGTNGPYRYQGGMPRFDVTGYTLMGSTSNSTPAVPYYRTNAQYQYVANLNWTKGRHDVRFGGEVNRQRMDHLQVTGTIAGGAGGFVFTGGATTTVGGPSANQFNAYAQFLLGLPSSAGISGAAGDPPNQPARGWVYSAYVRDRWTVTPRLTISYGMRWEYFPLPTRGDTGIGLYDTATNLVSICGVGAVPSDCGVNMSKKLFAPRLGIAYRVSKTFVIRAGYGLTNDPWPLSKTVRNNYPIFTASTFTGANAFQPYQPISQGIPPITFASNGNGIIPAPAEYAMFFLPKDFKRGYIQSWNLTLEKELGLGLVAQAGYVATRSTDKIGNLDVNAGQIPGLGRDGQPYYKLYGRTTSIVEETPNGTNQYNGLQTSLERRFAAGLQLGFRFTWAKTMAANGAEGGVLVPALNYFNLNRAVASFDRTLNYSTTGAWQLPFGKGKMLANGGVAAAVLSNWQLNGLLIMETGLPFSVTAASTSLNMPGNTQRADQVTPDVKILGNVGTAGPYFDPLAFAPVTQARFGNAGFFSLRGPGLVNLDLGLSRSFRVKERYQMQFRAEAFNSTNTPHFANPGANVSNRQLNADGSVRNLAGFAQILAVANTGRDGIDERQFRLSLKVTF
jgi:Carboxypeptidase regulatory-like domain/TonB dependent receptor